VKCNCEFIVTTMLTVQRRHGAHWAWDLSVDGTIFDQVPWERSSVGTISSSIQDNPRQLSSDSQPARQVSYNTSVWFYAISFLARDNIYA